MSDKLNIDSEQNGEDEFAEGCHSPSGRELAVPPRNFDIDMLSLELLSNSAQYKKYLAKSDPHEHAKRRGASARHQKHKERVMTMLMDLLEEYDDLGTFSTIGNSEIQRQFKSCVDKIIEFAEWTSYKDQDYGPSVYDKDHDENMMFGTMDGEENDNSANLHKTKKPTAATHKTGFPKATSKPSGDLPIRVESLPLSDAAKSFWGKKVTKKREDDPFA